MGIIRDTDPLTNDEVKDLLSSTLHGELPKRTTSRLLATAEDCVRRRAQVEALAGRLEEEQAEARRLRAQLKVVETPVTDVWFWQGDSDDRPGSIACPVVMEAETVQGFVRDIEAAALRQERLHALVRLMRESAIDNHRAAVELAERLRRERDAADERLLLYGLSRRPVSTGSREHIERELREALARCVPAHVRTEVVVQVLRGGKPGTLVVTCCVGGSQ